MSVHKGFIHLVLKQPPTLTVLKCVLMQDQHSSHGYDALFAVETHTGDWAWWLPTKHDSDAMEELDDDDAERRDTVTAAVAAAESKIIRSKRASGLPPQYFIHRTTVGASGVAAEIGCGASARGGF